MEKKIKQNDLNRKQKFASEIDELEKRLMNR